VQDFLPRVHLAHFVVKMVDQSGETRSFVGFLVHGQALSLLKIIIVSLDGTKNRGH